MILPQGNGTFVSTCPLVVMNGTQDIRKVFLKSRQNNFVFCGLMWSELEDIILMSSDLQFYLCVVD